MICHHGYLANNCITCQAAKEVVALRDNVAVLEKERDGCRDLIAALRNRAAGLERAIQRIKANSYLDDDVLNRHSCTTTGCEALRDAFALLTEASDGK